MANFTIADIKALREQLGTGMVDTKKALEEADGDVEKAVEILRLKGAKGNAKRADRSTSEGLVAAVEQDGKVTLIELACETDFVAKNDSFIALADKVAGCRGRRRAPTRSRPRSPRPPAARPSPTAHRRRGRDHRREGRTASRAHALRRQVRDLPAQDQQGPAPAGRRRPRLLGRRRRDRSQHRAAHLVREPDVPDPRRGPGRRSTRSARSSPRSPATRASPRPPCRRSSRAASTRSSSRSRCSTRTTRRTTSCPSRKVAKDAGLTLTGFARFKVGA